MARVAFCEVGIASYLVRAVHRNIAVVVERTDAEDIPVRREKIPGDDLSNVKAAPVG